MRMLNGYFDGIKIVPEGNIPLVEGQRVIIYVPDEKKPVKGKVDLSRYIGKGDKMLDMDAQEYVRGLRDNDRV